MADYGTAEISTALGGAASALEGAQARLAAAGQHADGAMARMARSGFPGIARGIAGIKTEIETAHAQIGSVIPDVRSQAGTVATVTDQSTPDQAVKVLSPVGSGVDHCTSGCLAADESLSKLEGTIRRVLSGGSPEELLAKVGPARAALTAARKQLETAKSAATSAIQQAGKAGTSDKG